MLELQTLIQTLGPAGLAFFIMYLWLKSVEKDKDTAQTQLAKEQEARVTELKEMIPLLTETSKGLQEIVQTIPESNVEVIKEITRHIDEKIKEIQLKCKDNQN